MAGIGNMDKSIKFPSKTDQVAVADEFLENWLRAQNISEDIIANIAIAVTELVNNAIKHGNKLQDDKFVTMAVGMKGNEVTVSVTDQGEGFNPENVPDPLSQENLLKEIGRGIFIVKSMMDSVEFEFPPDGGTRVKVSKTLD
jgi:serine/threonine-protein kinase RsbW